MTKKSLKEGLCSRAWSVGSVEIKKKKLPYKIRPVFRKQEVTERNDGLSYFVNIRNMKVDFFFVANQRQSNEGDAPSLATKHSTFSPF